MIRPTLASFAIAIFLFSCGQAWSQPRPLPAEVRWVEFGVVLGRVRIVETRSRQNRRSSTNDPAEGSTESLVLWMHENQPAVRYEYSTPEQVVSIDLEGGCHLRIHREPVGNSGLARVEFHQPASGKVRLQIDDGVEVRSFEADDLWLLLLAHSEDCAEHLIPLLERLRPHWRLLERSDEINELIFSTADRYLVVERSHWEKLIEQLDSAQYSERRAAQRCLRSAGNSVLPFLRDLDGARLSTEQRHRIGAIVRGLEVPTIDTPQRTASWMREDPSVWIEYLNQSDPHRRVMAVHRLGLLLQTPIAFDPLGSESVRRQQVELIRSRWVRR